MKTSRTRTDLLSTAGRAIAALPSLITLANIVLIVASLYWAQTFLIPIALAVMLTFLLSPVASAVERTRLGRIPSVILIVVLTFSLLAAISWVVTIEFTNLGNELPKYTGNIRQKIADVRGAGKGGALENVQKTIDEVKQEIQKKEEPVKEKEKTRLVVVESPESSRFWPIPMVSSAMFEPLAAAGLVIVLVVFMLVRREDLRNRLIRFVGYGRLTFTTTALEEAGQRISHYLLMQTIINSAFGLAVGAALFLIGVPYAVLWGFFAAVLRFIPYVGPFAAAIMPSVLSLAVFQGWLWPVLVVGIFVALELSCNMVLEPLLYAESAGVSGVGLLVAIAFWTWLWGPVGLVLATPLTVCVVVLSKYVPGMDFIAVLISDQPAMESNISYYQRLLAMDQAEAADIVELHLKNHPKEQLFDEVLIPALNYARRDRELGRVTEDGEQFVFRATREIVDELNTLPPHQSSAISDIPELTIADENSEPRVPKILILGCPAQDEADELAILMFRQLIDCAKYEVEILSNGMLASEVVDLIGDKNPTMIFIATVSPRGFAQTRYLCKRLRTRFPTLKIAVGRWSKGEASNMILLSGADKVGTTMVETRDQMIQLCQIGTPLETQSPKPIIVLSSYNAASPKVVA